MCKVVLCPRLMRRCKWVGEGIEMVVFAGSAADAGAESSCDRGEGGESVDKGKGSADGDEEEGEADGPWSRNKGQADDD